MPMQALALHLKATRVFIDMNPTELVFSRRPPIDDGNGGYTLGAATELSAQSCRVVGQNSRMVGLAGQRVSPNGSIQSDTIVLVGLPEMDVRAKDKFLWEGQKYEVASIEKNPKWAIRAKAELRG